MYHIAPLMEQAQISEMCHAQRYAYLSENIIEQPAFCCFAVRHKTASIVKPQPLNPISVKNALSGK